MSQTPPPRPEVRELFDMTPFSRFVYRCVRGSLYCFFRLYFRIEYHGVANLPVQGGALLVSNHASNLDPPILGCGLPRFAYALGKQELYDLPLLKTLLRCLNTLPLRRGAMDRSMLNLCIDKMSSGEMLLAFPEGTRTHDGRPGEGKPGVAMLAVRAGVPCVPTYIQDSYRALPRGRLFPRPCKIRVFFGKPFDLPEKNEDTPTKEHYKRCVEIMMREIVALGESAA